ncbi:MAG: fused MFS/spermidine synthase [Myxococcota bacterium]
MRRLGVPAALVFSGFTALVYQIIWTRLLGFAFGTTTEAISTVLAVFFGGLALGNLAAARWLHRVERPLRVYAALEAGIGLYALLSLPLLQRLPTLPGWLGVESDAGLLALRVLGAACVLLPPTVAMGATLPVVARAWVRDDARIGAGSAQLYAANTFGAVLGAYLSGFWLIPYLGLTHAVWLSGGVNLAVALAVGAWAGGRRVPPLRRVAAPGGRHRAAYLACFGISGFVAIGYEIVWSKVFGVIMEGTLYGFATVLSAYLLGIGLGSAAVARVADRLRDLPRAFALLHVAIGVCVVLGTALIPYLPFLYENLARMAPGGDAIHLLYLVVLPIVLVPTALFGAAFPILVKIDAADAGEAGRSVGLATAVNTAGSIAASLAVGFWWIPSMGMDGSLYALLMIDFAAALALLAVFQQTTGAGRVRALAGSAAVVGMVSLSYGGVHVEQAVAARSIRTEDLSHYLEELERSEHARAITLEGRSAIVSVYVTPTARTLRTNGQPEAGVRLDQPYAPIETVMLGLWPYLLADDPQRGLVVGLGGGNTLDALLETRLASIDVVELEPDVVRAAKLLHEGRPDPLDDPRVSLRVADGRHDLLLNAQRGAPGYDVIASQPSHPWRVGAANLFTEEFFRIARSALREGGTFAAWLNGFRIDDASALAVFTSFERVFPGSLLVDISGKGRMAFLLVGSTRPIEPDLARLRRRLAEPRLARYLALHETGDVHALLARIEGPGAVFAAVDPELANTDDNAFVETRTPRALDWQQLDFPAIERRLPPTAPLLPPVSGDLDVVAVADALDARPAADARWPYEPALARLLAQHAERIDPWDAAHLRARAALRDPGREDAARQALLHLAAERPDRPEPHRTLGHHLATRRSNPELASRAFAAAWERSGAARDAYDAGRALHPSDPDGAWQWFERIPASDRDDHPRLAWYEARRALDEGDDAALEAIRPRLLAWLESEEGRRYPGGHQVASRLAFRLGRRAEAQAHADLDSRQRAAAAAPLLRRAEQALADGRLDDAEHALRGAARQVPGSERVSLLRAELALARDAPDRLAAAFATLRRFAPDAGHANAVENHFRSRHGLPLRAEGAEPDRAPPLGAPAKVR